MRRLRDLRHQRHVDRVDLHVVDDEGDLRVVLGAAAARAFDDARVGEGFDVDLARVFRLVEDAADAVVLRVVVDVVVIGDANRLERLAVVAGANEDASLIVAVNGGAQAGDEVAGAGALDVLDAEVPWPVNGQVPFGVG